MLRVFGKELHFLAVDTQTSFLTNSPSSLTDQHHPSALSKATWALHSARNFLYTLAFNPHNPSGGRNYYAYLQRRKMRVKGFNNIPEVTPLAVSAASLSRLQKSSCPASHHHPRRIPLSKPGRFPPGVFPVPCDGRGLRNGQED